MAEALLISKLDVIKYTSIDGNIDYDKLLPHIKVAQDIWIQQYTGTDLLNKIKSDIIADTLSGDYLSLITNYLKPMLVHYSMVEYLPFASYQISNQGVYQKEVESSQSVNYEDVLSLTEKYKKRAEHYAQRFIDYINFNQNLFPEYNSNSNGDMYPNNQTYQSNWYL